MFGGDLKQHGVTEKPKWLLWTGWARKPADAWDQRVGEPAGWKSKEAEFRQKKEREGRLQSLVRTRRKVKAAEVEPTKRRAEPGEGGEPACARGRGETRGRNTRRQLARWRGGPGWHTAEGEKSVNSRWAQTKRYLLKNTALRATEEPRTAC